MQGQVIGIIAAVTSNPATQVKEKAPTNLQRLIVFQIDRESPAQKSRSKGNVFNQFS
jgi:hypothetical protein